MRGIEICGGALDSFGLWPGLLVIPANVFWMAKISEVSCLSGYYVNPPRGGVWKLCVGAGESGEKRRGLEIGTETRSCHPYIVARVLEFYGKLGGTCRNNRAIGLSRSVASAPL